MAISKPILEQTIEEYKKQMAVNGEGVYNVVKNPLYTPLNLAPFFLS
jgi:hypothetical protein